MAKSAAEISQQIRAQLKVLDPAISADPITPERKIIDTVAEVFADNQIDYYVLNYQFDIDTKVGRDLDKFVALFGFARQGGRRATGTVTFGRATPADHDILIDIGTQVVKPATIVSSASSFFTTSPVVLPTGATSVEAPIEAADVGPLGNVPAFTITTLGASAAEISSVSNENGTTGGTDVESDAELRVRFKNTIFRNIAGTKDQYLALAIASRFANKANVIGPQSRYNEWLQIPSSRTVTSLIPYSKYTYPFDYYLTDGDAVNETFYTPGGVDYTFTGSVPPVITTNGFSTTLTGSTTLPASSITVTSTSGASSSGGTISVGGQIVAYTGISGNTFTGTTGGTGTLPAGTVVTYGTLLPGTIALLEHTYCSINSRNDPVNNILNYVDVYVSGQDGTTATDVVQFPTNSFNFSASSASAYYTANFKRTATGTAPVVGNRYMSLLWQPILTLPSTIIVQGQPYYLGTDYWQVSDTTNYRGSRRSRDGIEWSAAAAASILTGTEIILSYSFDRLPLTLNELMDRHKQITTDVLVHSATERYLNVNLIVMYSPGFVKASVDEAVSIALDAFLQRQLFGTILQISDILDVVHSVPGIDNVRLALPSDGVSYGIQEVAADGVTPIGPPTVIDIFLSDADLPVLNTAFLYARSQNTWGA